ncbi:hypothetical protein Hdeb2414_s0003g00113021 [Helianthus debilis subsp. tardiflorus]
MMAVPVTSHQFLHFHLLFPCSPQIKFLVAVYSLVSSHHSPPFSPKFLQLQLHIPLSRFWIEEDTSSP